MKKFAALCAVALLAGCMTPAELRQAGVHHSTTSKLAPAAAAACIGRAAEGWRSNLQAVWREGVTPGSFEVSMKVGDDAFMADVLPAAAGGSLITLHTSPYSPLGAGVADAIRVCP